jgi:RHS repeat-associated protein
MPTMTRLLATSRLALAAWLLMGLANAHAGDTVTKVTLVMTDLQGNVLMTKDTQGHILARYTYQPYGTQQSGPTNNGPGYTGHVNDPATGLVYMQQRYYDPAVGRFISPDPVGPTPGNVFNFGRYTYANNNPIRNIDPFGLYACGSKVSDDDCKKIDGFVNKVNESLKGLKKGSNAYNRLLAVSKFLGTKNDGNGVTIKTATLKQGIVGRASGLKTMKLDLKQIAGVLTQRIKARNPGLSTKEAEVVSGGTTVAHETQHLIDANRLMFDPTAMKMLPQGFPGTDDPIYEMATERNAYGVEAAFGRGLSVNVGYTTPAQIEAAALGSCQAFGACK